MAILSKCFVVVALATLCGAASAQIVTTGPFTGQQSDGFETQTTGVFPTCVQGRVFNNTADLCDFSNAAQHMHVTSGWGFMCTIGPHGGGLFCASAGGPAEYVFDQPATRFGGYFATNSGTADATAEFYDGAGNLLSSLNVTAPAGNGGTCIGWAWNGWQVVGGAGISRVKIIGLNGFNGGGFIDMDDMEVDYGTPCPPPVTYCTAKVNSLGCTPTISATGTASATSPSGLMIQGTNMRNNKAGLLIYGVSGRAALPFFGGRLCLLPPIKRTPSQSSGGTPAPASDCSGVYAIDVNSLAQGMLGGGVPLAALRTPGTVVNCQFWGVDPGFAAPNNVTLSEGLEYVVCP